MRRISVAICTCHTTHQWLRTMVRRRKNFFWKSGRGHRLRTEVYCRTFPWLSLHSRWWRWFKEIQNLHSFCTACWDLCLPLPSSYCPESPHQDSASALSWKSLFSAAPQTIAIRRLNFWWARWRCGCQWLRSDGPALLLLQPRAQFYPPFRVPLSWSEALQRRWASDIVCRGGSTSAWFSSNPAAD